MNGKELQYVVIIQTHITENTDYDSKATKNTKIQYKIYLMCLL